MNIAVITRIAGIPFFSCAFRPFFFSALVYSIASMILWIWQYLYGWHNGFSYISLSQWHGHEMIFGYSLAVIGGFMLTAAENWTNRPSLRHSPLLLIWLLWLFPRAGLVFFTDTILWVGLVSVCLFYPFLAISITRLLIKTKNNRQWAIIGKALTLWLLEVLFFLAALAIISPAWISQILLASVYTIIALILMMAQRLLPFFTERIIPPNIKNIPALNIAMLIFFSVFMIADIFRFPDVMWVSGSLTAAVGIAKLFLWYRNGIWLHSLLWVLWVAYAFVIIGIGLRANAALLGIFPSLPLHFMTYGGIGMVTMGMMARVTLGHTGRNVRSPPSLAKLGFAILAIGALVRSLVPIFLPSAYVICIVASQLLWILAFVIILLLYIKPLTTASIPQF